MNYTSAKRIIRFAAFYYDRPGDELLTRDKRQPIAQQRHVAMWLCRNDTDLSYPSIGAAFGRDHSTIISGVRRIDRLLRASTRNADAVRRDIERIRALLATDLPSPLLAHLSVCRGSVPA